VGRISVRHSFCTCNYFYFSNDNTENKETVLKLENTAKAEFLKVFGNPNTENESEGSIILGYYFDALCANEKLIDSADYCIAEFTFKQDKLTQRNFICR